VQAASACARADACTGTGCFAPRFCPSALHASRRHRPTSWSTSQQPVHRCKRPGPLQAVDIACTLTGRERQEGDDDAGGQQRARPARRHCHGDRLLGCGAAKACVEVAFYLCCALGKRGGKGGRAEVGATDSCLGPRWGGGREQGRHSCMHRLLIHGDGGACTREACVARGAGSRSLFDVRRSGHRLLILAWQARPCWLLLLLLLFGGIEPSCHSSHTIATHTARTGLARFTARWPVLPHCATPFPRTAQGRTQPLYKQQPCSCLWRSTHSAGPPHPTPTLHCAEQEQAAACSEREGGALAHWLMSSSLPVHVMLLSTGRLLHQRCSFCPCKHSGSARRTQPPGPPTQAGARPLAARLNSATHAQMSPTAVQDAEASTTTTFLIHAAQCCRTLPRLRNRLMQAAPPN